MTMYHIKNYQQTMTMSCVNQVFELIRITITAEMVNDQLYLYWIALLISSELFFLGVQ